MLNIFMVIYENRKKILVFVFIRTHVIILVISGSARRGSLHRSFVVAVAVVNLLQCEPLHHLALQSSISAATSLT